MTSSVLRIRKASFADAGVIASIGRSAFTDAYGAFNSELDLRTHLERTYSREKIESEISSGAQYLILQIGLVDGGFAKLRMGTPAKFVPGSHSMEVHQIYLLSSFHRCGYGTILMNAATELARESGADGIYLGVWEKATWAIGFYERFGMSKIGSQIFRVGSDDQTDIIMYKPVDLGRFL